MLGGVYIVAKDERSFFYSIRQKQIKTLKMQIVMTVSTISKE
jgi:hypothetical protein